MSVLRLSVLALLLIAPVAHAADTPRPDAKPSDEATAAVKKAGGSTSAAESEDPMDRKVCKKIQGTGSRMGGERVCMTRAQWKKAGY